MITKEQIKNAASKYAKGNAPTADQSFCAIDFRAGARWAIEQTQAENARLNLENAAIAGERDAAILENSHLVELLKNAAADIDNLKSICDEAIKEARSHVYENERLRAAIQSALTRMENGYNRGAMSALLEAIEK